MARDCPTIEDTYVRWEKEKEIGLKFSFSDWRFLQSPSLHTPDMKKAAEKQKVARGPAAALLYLEIGNFLIRSHMAFT